MKLKSIFLAAIAMIMAAGCNGQDKVETFHETSLQNN